MNILIRAVEKAGLNRGKVMGAFREYVNKKYDGVAATAQFDATLNNIAPRPAGRAAFRLGLARVEGGRFVYWNPRAEAATDAKTGGQH
jgi:hypothetical protein